MTLTNAHPPSADRPREDAAAIAMLWIPVGAALVAALIVALAFGLVRLAQWTEQHRPPIVTDTEEGAFLLTPDLAALRGEKVVAQTRDDAAILEWNDLYGRAVWRIYAPQPGEYDVTLTLACAPGEEGSDVFIRLAGQELEIDIPATGGWDDFTQVAAGRVNLPQRGVYEVRIEAASLAGTRLMNLKSVSLTPAVKLPPVVEPEPEQSIEPQAESPPPPLLPPPEAEEPEQEKDSPDPANS